MSSKRGFTLVELLIAITLISLLSSMAIASYQASRRNARNANRRGDITALKTAFEQYYVVNDSAYPTDCNQIVTGGYIRGLFPTDPASGMVGDPSYTGYTGTTSCTDTSYCFCAQLEDSEGNAYDGVCDFIGPGDLDWFCVQNQQ